MNSLKTRYRRIKHIPVIIVLYFLIIPVVILDILAEIYHRICFPICGLPYVKRKDYIRIDRHKLSYLNFRQKLGCVYCGYTNGVMAYWVRIAGDTEQYWCGIKHKTGSGFHEPTHHENFVEFGDEEQFVEKYKS